MGVGNDISHYHIWKEGVGIEIDPGIQIGKEANGGGIDYHIGFRRNRVSRFPG